MTEDIRKKHEEQKKLWAGFEFPERIRSIYSMSDVDRLFAALDEAQAIIKRFKAFVDERDRIYGGMMARDQLQTTFRKILSGVDE